MNPNTKKLLGALVAAALAIAAYYGVVSQQQATSIQNQANQTLGTTPASQQAGPQQTVPQQTAQPAPAPPTAPAPQAPTAQH